MNELHEKAKEIAQLLQETGAQISWPDGEEEPNNFALMDGGNGEPLFIVVVEHW